MAQSKGTMSKPKVNKDGFELGKPIEASDVIAFLAKKRQERKETK